MDGFTKDYLGVKNHALLAKACSLRRHNSEIVKSIINYINLTVLIYKSQMVSLKKKWISQFHRFNLKLKSNGRFHLITRETLIDHNFFMLLILQSCCIPASEWRKREAGGSDRLAFSVSRPTSPLTIADKSCFCRLLSFVDISIHSLNGMHFDTFEWYIYIPIYFLTSQLLTLYAEKSLKANT